MPTKAPTSADYDLINRQQSQLLLDMIYATKKPCFFSTKVPCPGTPAAAAVAEKSMAEELASIKATLADLQKQITALPGQIVAAIQQEMVKGQIQNQDVLVDEEDELDLEDFDRLSSSSSVSTATMSTAPPKASACTFSSLESRSTSMSSDIEVLNYHCSRPVCSNGKDFAACSSTSSIPVVSITKEILLLNEKLKAFEMQPKANIASTPFASSSNGKAIAGSIFSHWEARFAASTENGQNNGRSTSGSSSAPTGNIVTPTKPVNILPYSPSIDVSFWLK